MWVCSESHRCTFKNKKLPFCFSMICLSYKTDVFMCSYVFMYYTFPDLKTLFFNNSTFGRVGEEVLVYILNTDVSGGSDSHHASEQTNTCKTVSLQ